MTQPIQITVDVSDRVDKALARHFPAAGRRQLAELFDAGHVKVAGKRAKKGDRVAPGDIVELAVSPVSGDALQPLPDPEAASQIELLLERPDLIVIAKPAGMPSQPLRAGELGTAANAIAARWPECAALGDDRRDGGLVHRLDIGTSGALIAARTAAAYRTLREAFRGGTVVKTYLAITSDCPVSASATPRSPSAASALWSTTRRGSRHTRRFTSSARPRRTRWCAAPRRPAACTRSARISRTSAHRSSATRCTAAPRYRTTTGSSSTPPRSRCRSPSRSRSRRRCPSDSSPRSPRADSAPERPDARELIL
ncbi:MAG: pseudouridine synthase [Kofleriaceae bacterium]